MDDEYTDGKKTAVLLYCLSEDGDEEEEEEDDSEGSTDCAPKMSVFYREADDKTKKGKKTLMTGNMSTETSPMTLCAAISLLTLFCLFSNQR